ncbi:MAG TPA: hypothetical protein VGD22_05655 [Sphingobacteriaceae bacterium]
MPVVRIRYKGRIYIRTVTRNLRGWFIMESKGKEYWFQKDPDEHYGWRIISSNSIDQEFFEQIVPQLEELSKSK